MLGTVPSKVPELPSLARSLSTSCHLVELVVGAGKDEREEQEGKGPFLKGHDPTKEQERATLPLCLQPGWAVTGASRRPVSKASTQDSLLPQPQKRWPLTGPSCAHGTARDVMPFLAPSSKHSRQVTPSHSLIMGNEAICQMPTCPTAQLNTLKGIQLLSLSTEVLGSQSASCLFVSMAASSPLG